MSTVIQNQHRKDLMTKNMQNAYVHYSRYDMLNEPDKGIESPDDKAKINRMARLKTESLIDSVIDLQKVGDRSTNANFK